MIALLARLPGIDGIRMRSASHLMWVSLPWWSWPSHPPFDERIRRAHPRFLQEDYRRTRHAATYRDGRVAVLDGAGNVVKVAGGLASLAAVIEAPRAEHVDHARRLLDALPAETRQRLATPEGAAQVVLEGLGQAQQLLVFELALPALKQFPQKRRVALLAEVRSRIEAVRKVSLA